MAGVTFSLGDVRVYPDAGQIVIHSPEAGVEELMDEKVQRIRARASELAPKRTGHLAGSGESGREGDTWYVRFTAHYALFVEMGHRIVSHHRTVGYQPPRPYLRPALDSEAGG